MVGMGEAEARAMCTRKEEKQHKSGPLISLYFGSPSDPGIGPQLFLSQNHCLLTSSPDSGLEAKTAQ